MEGIGVEFVDVTPEEFVRFLELVNKMNFDDKEQLGTDWGIGLDCSMAIMFDEKTGNVLKIISDKILSDDSCL